MNIDYLGIIAIALAGSFGHCLGMCGGLVLAYSSAKMDASLSYSSQAIRHLAYHFGRVFIYCLFGLIVGYFGSLIFEHSHYGFVLYFVAGAVMIITSLAMLGISKALLSIEYSLQNYSWFKNSFTKLIKSQTLKSFVFLGMLNGLFPCGFVYFFLAKAAVSNSFIDGFLIMLVFGLSTIPALFLAGSSATLFRSLEFRNIASKISAILILIFGAVSIYRGVISIL